MPLLKKKLFEKQSLPDFLRDDEEVFYCEITNEIFRDYEEFSERMFLYNSMVWTCAMTGKSNLTYQEAIESEENAKKSLKEFPLELRLPILYLANKTQRSSFGDMAEDVFAYVKDRYFTGENLETSFTGSKWKDSHVLQVIAPSEEQLKNVPRTGSSPSDRHFWPPANQFKYEIEHLDADDNDISEIMIVDCNQIRRRKGVFSREKCKLFLKQYAEPDSKGLIVIKQSVLDDFGIMKMKFDQIFDGPLPQFEISKKLEKPSTNMTLVPKKKAQKQETLAKFLAKNNGVSNASLTPKTSKEDRKVNLLEEMKKREEEFQLKKALREEEKQILKKKQKEEYVKITSFIREWSKVKEDLLLEDQKVLPLPMPIKSNVPEQYFGDILMFMDFVENFSKFLFTKDFFPGGISLELMERALMQQEIAGPFTDIIHMLLTALFHVQDEEARQYGTSLEKHTPGVKEEELPENLTLTDASHLATLASRWSSRHQGLPLRKLPLYSVTVSEILRLHLLSSGARINDNGSRWRFAQRGGYNSEDDPGLQLRISYPHILKALGIHNVVQLPIDDKLKIISCLISQLLTYADVRDFLDERLEKIRQIKLELKNLQLVEKKREQELVTSKLKLKNEMKNDKQKLKDAMEELDKDHEKKQIENNRKISKVFKSLYDLQSYMGSDRANRKYYRIDSIPAIIVSNEERILGDCLPEITKQNPDLVNANRQQLLKFVRKTLFNNGKTVNGVLKNENIDKQSVVDLLMCNADPATCPVHTLSSHAPVWSFFYDKFNLDELENNLNKRGVRESELLLVIKNDKDRLLNIISRTPVHILNPNSPCIEGEDEQRPDTRNHIKKLKNRYEDANLGYSLQMPPEEVLENTLVDNILELEEKMYAGSLGNLMVGSRKNWRRNLSEKVYDDFNLVTMKRDKAHYLQKIKKGYDKHQHSRSTTPEDESKKYEDPGRYLGSTGELNGSLTNDLMQTKNLEKTIKALAIALAQVAQGVDLKYLKKPLGHADVTSKDRKFDRLENWEQSLLASTSFSQVFLHYGTLDSCIMWSRSALLARCRICRRQKDSENMLLCDNCNLGHHLYCLKPKLTSIPKGDWFCDKCKKQTEKEPEPAPKKKRKIFRDVEEEESNESAEEQSVEEEELNEDTEVDEENKNCKQCSSGGDLITCEKCSSNYHIECCEPPLRRPPRGSWHCHQCVRRSKKKEDSSDSESEVVLAVRINHRREVGREDLPLHNAALQELLSDLMKQEEAWPFLRPVQTKEVPDYYDIITKPMDFGTIKYKLNMGEYKTDGELMKDAALVFENCNAYNDSDADVYKCGVKLLTFFEKRAKDLGLKLPEEMGNVDHQPKSKRRRIEL